jgi:hypothetical protein
MEAFPLDAVFTAPGALVGAAVVTAIVEMIKRLTAFPSTGRAPMLLAAFVAALLIGLATLDADELTALELGQRILTVVLAWLNVATAAIGTHATARKVHAVATGTTDTRGPDNDGGVG